MSPIRPALAALALAACSSSSATPPDSGVDLGGTLPPGDAADDASPGDVPVTVDGAATDAGHTLPAFPGAQGWAANTPGGRGGQIIRVTTLSPGGTGSLAAALAAQGPRIIVFEVGGVIDMMGARYMVTMPYVTIAGQTAPSPGITLIRGGIIIRTHDVILQHVRVRPGEAGRAKMSGWEVDSISTDTGAYNVIVDHCSTTWGTDENLSASGGRFDGATPDDWRNATSHIITFSNNIVAEGLSNSTHAEGEHSKGGLIHDNVTKIAIIGNLYASNNERHPLFKGGARGLVANNYVSNPGRDAMRYNLSATEWTGHPPELGQMSIVGNVYQAGQNTMADVPLLRVTGIGMVEVYLADNIAKTLAGGDAPAIAGTSAANAMPVSAAPLWPDGFTAQPATDVAASIRANVGARPWDRDAIDTRIVEQALGGGGAIINSEVEVGGYPMFTLTQATFVEDEWDLRFMVRKSGPADAGASDATDAGAADTTDAGATDATDGGAAAVNDAGATD